MGKKCCTMDNPVIEALLAEEAGAGAPFDMPVGGFAALSSGYPVRIQGTLAKDWASTALLLSTSVRTACSSSRRRCGRSSGPISSRWVASTPTTIESS